jgi:hypothetical protein
MSMVHCCGDSQLGFFGRYVHLGSDERVRTSRCLPLEHERSPHREPLPFCRKPADLERSRSFLLPGPILNLNHLESASMTASRIVNAVCPVEIRVDNCLPTLYFAMQSESGSNATESH